jgi:hypothetical protein
VSPQIPDQIFCFEVGVSAQHPQVVVTGENGDLHDVEALFDSSARSFVAQLVKA